MSETVLDRLAAAALCALHGAASGAIVARPSGCRVIVPFTPASATDIMARTVTRDALADSWASRSWSRTGRARAARSAIAARRQVRSRRLHDPSCIRLPYTITPSTYPRTLPYDTLRDLSGITPLGAPAQRAGDLALEGHPVGVGPGARREGEARRDELRVGGRRHRHAAERRALPPWRGHRHRARPVQGIARRR